MKLGLVSVSIFSLLLSIPFVAGAADSESEDAAETIAAGKKTYKEACGVCHDAGIANSPKLGDKDAWAPRIKTGMDALYETALKGKGGMPAKGGRADLSDDAVKAVVNYMVSQAK